MPLECEHGGDWKLSAYPPLQCRSCALADGQRVSGRIVVYEKACEKCSGKDEEGAFASKVINHIFHRAFEHNADTAFIQKLMDRGAKDVAEEAVLSALRFGKITEEEANQIGDQFGFSDVAHI